MSNRNATMAGARFATSTRLSGTELPDCFTAATLASAARCTALTRMADESDQRRLARKTRKLAPVTELLQSHAQGEPLIMTTNESKARSKQVADLLTALKLLARSAGYDLSTPAGYRQLIEFSGAMSGRNWAELSVGAGTHPPSSATILDVVLALKSEHDALRVEELKSAPRRAYSGARSYGRDRRADRYRANEIARILRSAR